MRRGDHSDRGCARSARRSSGNVVGVWLQLLLLRLLLMMMMLLQLMMGVGLLERWSDLAR